MTVAMTAAGAMPSPECHMQMPHLAQTPQMQQMPQMPPIPQMKMDTKSQDKKSGARLAGSIKVSP